MVRFVLLGLLFVSTANATLTIAEQEQQYRESLNWAQGAQQGITGQAQGNLSLSDYCADATCVNNVNNPSQAGMNDAQINNQKTTEFYANDTAGAMQQNFNKGRPDIKNDSAYEFALIGQEHAFDITHGNSNPYFDCNSGEQCIIGEVEKSCTRPTNAPVPCFEEPVFSDMNLNQGHTSYAAQENPNFPGYANGWSTVSLPSQAQAITGVYIPSFWTLMVWQRPIHFKINGQTVSIQNYIISSCNMICSGYTPGGFFAIDPPIKINGPVKLSTYSPPSNGLEEIHGDGWYGWASKAWNPPSNLVLHWNEPSYTLNWRSSCSNLVPECQPNPRRCIEGPETRNINGIDITLECWKYQTDYQCQFDDTCSALADCDYQSTSCSLMQNGVCVEEQVTKLCETKNCRDTSFQCGEVSFCLDGDCYDPMPQTSGDFDKSASGLAALADAAKDLGNPPKIFTGQGMQCTDKPIGIANCCQDGGWGTDIGITSCSEEEKALGQAKEQGTTIYLGDYCAEDIFGWCIRKKKSYCVFDSKLSRIIQEQGSKGQLGISLGSAEHPICGAITPEQLQQINFEHIDFSDFYEDMHNNANLPSANEIQDRLQSAYGN